MKSRNEMGRLAHSTGKTDRRGLHNQNNRKHLISSRYKSLKAKVEELLNIQLPKHLQIFSMTESEKQGRIDNLREKFDNGRDPSLKHPHNTIYRMMLERNQYLCARCREDIAAEQPIISNRHKLYHADCAIKLNMVPWVTADLKDSCNLKLDLY